MIRWAAAAVVVTAALIVLFSPSRGHRRGGQ